MGFTERAGHGGGSLDTCFIRAGGQNEELGKEMLVAHSRNEVGAGPNTHKLKAN